MGSVTSKPWGNYENLFTNLGEASISAKIITVNPKSRLSLQYHKHRYEYWFVLSGRAIVQLEKDVFTLIAGCTCTVPTGTLHRLGADVIVTQVLEIAIGQFDEDDIVRVEDDYGRA